MTFDDYAMKAAGNGRQYFVLLPTISKAAVLRAFIADDDCDDGDLLSDLIVAALTEDSVESYQTTARAYRTINAILFNMPHYLNNRYEDLMDEKKD